MANRKQRRWLAKRRKNINAGNGDCPAADWVAGPGPTRADKEEREPDIPGVTVRPLCPEYQAKCDRNIWHDLPELDEFIQTIKELANEDTSDWSWTANWGCKYINLRFDMRDGGFFLTDDHGKRINLEQLRWQYRSATPEEIAEHKVKET